MLRIRLLNEAGYKPERSTEQATGYDLRCMADFSVPAFSTVLVPLGFAMQVVSNGALIDAQIRPRSSVSLKGINTPIGTIDLDYRGEVKVCLQNITPKVIDFSKGDKIAQMVFSIYDTPIVQLKTELTTTERGEGGFGSTGR